jgi:hypothetical protein
MVISGLVTASGIVVCGVSVEKNKSLTLNNMKNRKKLQQPQTIEMLLKRRNAILRKMKQNSKIVGNQIEPREIQKVNEAYEYLKSDIDGTLEQLHQIHDAHQKQPCNIYFHPRQMHLDTLSYLPCGFSTDRLHLSRTQQHITSTYYTFKNIDAITRHFQ